MAWRIALGIVGAILLHAGILLFGRLLLPHTEVAGGSRRDVEIVTEDVGADRPEQEQVPEDTPELEEQEEPPPDAESSSGPAESPVAGDANDGPALDAASLSALEASLSGAGGGGADFGVGGTRLESGGRIGASGRGGALGGDEGFGGAFSMSEIDQRPRAIYQVAGAYPPEMRKTGTEGTVTLIFIVDETGRVANPKVERASHPEFSSPALDAVKQWKFEPAIKAGQRVSCRMRVTVRFQPPRNS
jgi:protein TonB